MLSVETRSVLGRRQALQSWPSLFVDTPELFLGTLAISCVCVCVFFYCLVFGLVGVRVGPANRPRLRWEQGAPARTPTGPRLPPNFVLLLKICVS